MCTWGEGGIPPYKRRPPGKFWSLCSKKEKKCFFSTPPPSSGRPDPAHVLYKANTRQCARNREEVEVGEKKGLEKSLFCPVLFLTFPKEKA